MHKFIHNQSLYVWTFFNVLELVVIFHFTEPDIIVVVFH